MDLDLVKTSTLTVLSGISDDELNTVTLPILRGKVAEYMKLAVEELLGNEIKRVILETFQEFLLSKNNEKSEDETIESESKDEPKKEEIDSATVKKVKEEKTVNNTEKKASKGASKTTVKTTSKSKAKDTDNHFTEDALNKSSTPSKPVPSAKSLQIEKLKSYVFKCGMRKVWKKELEGLNENQSIAKIQGILRELGIEGKPSLEQCKAIKSRREFEAELKEIDTSNIIEGKRRNRGSSGSSGGSGGSGGSDVGVNHTKRKLVISDDDEECDSDDSDESEKSDESKSFTIDLKNIGDSESD